MSEAKKKKKTKKKVVEEKIDEEEELLNQLIEQEKLSDKEEFDDYSGPNEFERLVDEVQPNVKKNFKDRIRVPEKVKAPKTFIVS